MGVPERRGAFTVKCRSCGSPLGNPFTHRCVTRSGFKKRRAEAAGPRPGPASTGNAHDYTACNNDDCPRFPCKIYREGRGDGVEIGRQLGFTEGYAKGERDGYDQGFPDGIAACPREHKG